MTLNHSRLQHDAAFAAAMTLLDKAASFLRPEDRKDYFDTAYAVCRAMLEAYQQQAQREEMRIHPSRN